MAGYRGPALGTVGQMMLTSMATVTVLFVFFSMQNTSMHHRRQAGMDGVEAEQRLHARSADLVLGGGAASPADLASPSAQRLSLDENTRVSSPPSASRSGAQQPAAAADVSIAAAKSDTQSPKASAGADGRAAPPGGVPMSAAAAEEALGLPAACYGSSGPVPCLRPASCAGSRSIDRSMRLAVVHVPRARLPLNDLHELSSSVRYYHPQAELFMLLADPLGSTLLDERELGVVKGAGIKILRSSAPPLSESLRRALPGDGDKADYALLHLFQMEEFEAVIVFTEPTTHLYGSLGPLLACARTRPLISTSSGGRAPLDKNMLILRPSKKRYEQMLTLLAEADVSEGQQNGWGGTGLARPGASKDSHFAFDASVAGFLFYFFYQGGAGALAAGEEPAAQVERCLYNYDRENDRGSCDVARAAPLIHAVKHYDAQTRDSPNGKRMGALRDQYRRVLQHAKAASMQARGAAALYQPFEEYSTPFSQLEAYHQAMLGRRSKMPTTTARDDYRLHIVHIPKSAGTSLSIPVRRALCLLNDKNSNCCVNPGYCHNHQGRSCTAIMNKCFGHTPDMLYLFGGIPSATILRHPIARTISAYFFRCHSPNHDCYGVRPEFRDIMSGKLPKVGFDEYLDMVEYSNIQTRMLGADSFPYSTVEVTEQTLAQAKTALDHFFFVGVTEAYNTSVMLLMHELGLQVQPEVDYVSSGERTMHANSPLRLRLKKDPEAHAEILKANKYDEELFFYAVDLFCRRLAKVGLLSHPTTQADFTSKRNRDLFRRVPSCGVGAEGGA